MATKELDSVVKIGGEDFSVTAAKVANKLTIQTMKDGNLEEKIFDGSASVTVKTGDADKVKVTLTNGTPAYAAITVSIDEPTGGNIGDIWFKY